MMLNRRTLYRPAFFFEQRRPLICNMLCSSVTRRSHHRAHTLCLLHTPILPTDTHSPSLFSLCRQKTLKCVACPQNFGSFFCYAIKKPRRCFFSFFLSLFLSAQTSQMDILIGTFGTVSILCWNGRRVSGW